MARRPSRIWSLGLLTCLFPAGCRSHPPADRSPGPVGYVSDRAHEIRVAVVGTVALSGRSACARDVRACERDPDVRAAVDRRLDTVASEGDARGEPLFLQRAARRARFSLEPRGDDAPPAVRFEVSVVSFAHDDDHPGKAWPYAARDGLRFEDDSAATLARALPRFVSADGRTRVSLVFGQIGKKDLWPDDPAHWSADEATRTLRAHGFEGERDSLRRGPIEVLVVRPDVARLRSKEAAEAVRRALAESDVVYVSGHARSGLFDALPRSDAPKLVFVDTCWSFALETNALREALPGATLVVTDGRVATGSVAVLPALLEAATREPRVGPWLKRVNDAAAFRAARRRENGTLDPVLKDAEVYGLVPPRAAP